MKGERGSWSAEGDVVARLGAAIAASLALHLGVMPSLVPGAGDPAQGAAPAAPLVARIAYTRDDSPGRAARPNALPSSSNASAEARTSARVDPTRHGALVAPSPRYFLASELDRRPVPLEPIEPRYPDDADARGGRVVLKLFIDEAGRVDDVVLVAGGDPFDRSATSAFGRARFSPGIRGGAPVKSQMLIEVTYHPPSGGSASPDPSATASAKNPG